MRHSVVRWPPVALAHTGNTKTLAAQSNRQMGMKNLLLEECGKIRSANSVFHHNFRSNSDVDCTGLRWFGLS